MDKLGLYINNLMTTVIDNEENLFVRSLAFEELQRLKVDISEFLLKHVAWSVKKYEPGLKCELC